MLFYKLFVVYRVSSVNKYLSKIQIHDCVKEIMKNKNYSASLASHWTERGSEFNTLVTRRSWMRIEKYKIYRYTGSVFYTVSRWWVIAKGN